MGDIMPLTFDPIIAQLLDDIESRFKGYRKLSPLEMRIASGVNHFRKVWEREVDNTLADDEAIAYVMTGPGGTIISGSVGKTPSECLKYLRIDGRVNNGAKIARCRVITEEVVEVLPNYRSVCDRKKNAT